MKKLFALAVAVMLVLPISGGTPPAIAQETPEEALERVCQDLINTGVRACVAVTLTMPYIRTLDDYGAWLQLYEICQTTAEMVDALCPDDEEEEGGDEGGEGN